jgi:hypothetical protein
MNACHRLFAEEVQDFVSFTVLQLNYLGELVTSPPEL